MAAIGMVLGQVIYLSGQKYLVTVGNKPKEKEGNSEDVSIKDIFTQQFSTRIPLTITLFLAVASSIVAWNFIEDQRLAYIIFFISGSTF